MESLVSVREYIASFERGRIFFINDVMIDVSPDIIRTSLSILNSEGFIKRLARGIYLFPSLSSDFKPKVLYPSDQSIAEHIASKFNCRILPSAEYCSYLLGLSKFNLSNLSFIIDGAPRSIVLYNGHKINFEHTSEVRIFAFRSITMQYLSLSIRYLGPDFATTVTRKRRIKELLYDVSEGDYSHDIMLMPAWVKKIVEDIKG